MKRTRLSSAALALAATLIWPVAAQDLASSIIGVWRLTTSVERDVASGATEPTQKSEEQNGYRIFTRGGHIFIFNVYKPRKAPAATTPTDAELAALFRTMSVFTGTYKVEGIKLTVRVDASWIESWNGSDRAFLVELAGNKLTMTVGPVKNTYTGKEILLISTLERVE